MKSFPSLTLAAALLLHALCGVTAHAQQTNVIYGYAGDYGIAPQRANVTLTLRWPNPRTYNNVLVRQDPMLTRSATDDGYFGFTNILWGVYDLLISGSGSGGTPFRIYVGTNTLGSVEIASLVTNSAALPPNNATNYYTIAQLEALLDALPGVSAAAGTNITLQTNGSVVTINSQPGISNLTETASAQMSLTDDTEIRGDTTITFSDSNGDDAVLIDTAAPRLHAMGDVNVSGNLYSTNAVTVSGLLSGAAASFTAGTTNHSAAGFQGNASGLTNLGAANIAAGGTLPALNARSLTNLPAVIYAADYGAAAAASSAANGAAIQAALNAASNGNVVILPVGNLYVTGQQLEIKHEGTTVRGFGPTRTALRTTSTTVNVFTNRNVTRCTFENFSVIKDAYDSTSTTTAFMWRNSPVTSTSGSRTLWQNIVVRGFYSGWTLDHPTGVTFINCEAYENVIGFNCLKVDAGVWISCFAGDGMSDATFNDADDFGAFTNSSRGWLFTDNGAGNYCLGNTLIACEGRRAARLVDVQDGWISIRNCNFEFNTSNFVYLASGTAYLTIENSRFSTAQGLNLIECAAGAADNLVIINCNMTSASGYYAISVNESGTLVPAIIGEQQTLTNSSSSTAYTLTSTRVAPGSGVSVATNGNVYTVSATGESGIKSGLVGWFDFDEAPGSDFVTNTIDAGMVFLTNNCTTQSRTNKVGNHLTVTNLTSDVAVLYPGHNPLKMDGAWTIAAWVRAESITGFNATSPIVGLFSATSDITYGLCYAGSSVNRWQAAGGGATVNWNVTSTVTVGTWRFIVVWYDGSNIYIEYNNNGTPQSAAAGPTIPPEGQWFGFGHGGMAGHSWDIDSVGLWSRVLTADERTALYNSGNGVHYDDL